MTSKYATYTTARGARVTLTLTSERTERINLDGDICERTIACNELTCTVNGKDVNAKRINDPVHGAALRFELVDHVKRTVTPVTLPIPADKLAEVDAVLAAHKRLVDAALAAQDRRIAAEIDYLAHCALIKRAC